MTIAVIDDGVNSLYYPIIEKLVFDLEVSRNGFIRKRSFTSNINSHGTTCAAIIKKYAPEASIGSIKILSKDSLKGNINHLIAAIKWCLDHKIFIIHLSVGSRQMVDYDKIKKIIIKLIENKHSIICALSNDMKFTIPACFSGVLSVKANISFSDNKIFLNNEGLDAADFVASGIHELTNYLGKSEKTSSCNSFAAPIVTAHVHRLINQHGLMTSNQIKMFFSDNHNIVFIASRLDFFKKLNKKTIIYKKYKFFVNKTGFIYCGKMSKIILSYYLDTGCLVYNDNFYIEMLKFCSFESTNIKNPFIFIYDIQNSPLITAKMLYLVLSNLGYNCRVFSNIESAYLYDIDWIPNEIEDIKFIARQSEYMSLDYTIYVSKDAGSKTLSLADVCITNDNRKFSNSLRVEKKTIFVPQKLTKHIIKKIVEQIFLIIS